MTTRDLKKLETAGDKTAKAVLDEGYREANPLEPTRSSNPEIHRKLDADMRQFRGETGIPHGEGGGTVGVGRTDLAGLENELFRGASPRAGGTPETTFEPPSEHGKAQGHAEQNLAAKVDSAIQQSGLTTQQMKGKSVWMRIEQEVCSTCKSGLLDPETGAGVLRQLSEKYRDITFEISAEGTSEILRIRGGVRVP